MRTSPVLDVWSAMPCIACGCPGTQRCTTGPCKRPTRQQRGYGAEHDRLRAAWVELVEDGKVDCDRCGLPIQPGTPWDLGHDDIDRTKWSGPEHPGCNRSAGGRAAHGLPPRPRRSTEDDDL